MPKRKDGWMLGGLPHDSARYKHLHVYVPNRPEYRQTKRHIRKKVWKIGPRNRPYSRPYRHRFPNRLHQAYIASSP